MFSDSGDWIVGAAGEVGAFFSDVGGAISSVFGGGNKKKKRRKARQRAEARAEAAKNRAVENANSVCNEAVKFARVFYEEALKNAIGESKIQPVGQISVKGATVGPFWPSTQVFVGITFTIPLNGMDVEIFIPRISETETGQDVAVPSDNLIYTVAPLAEAISSFPSPLKSPIQVFL